jgi:DNA-directed RNA polymerase subunit RPC12/RpoP
MQFEAAGEGRFRCPSCGTLNEIREPSEAPPVREPAEPEAPSPRVSCPDCGFRFIVGDVEKAPCPNCGAPVTVTEEEP